MIKKYINIFTYTLSIFFIAFNSTSEEINMREILEIIQKDLRTLERAVYSESFQKKSGGETSLSTKETEDALTRHLLKLSEIEKQFQNLTNKFEEINFKIDKLSTRLSKTQADNQLRFQELENNSSIVKNSENNEQNLSTNEYNENTNTNLASKKIMPGTSQPQDLGSISYKDMTDTSETQAIQSVDTTKTILTENFINEEKILPDASPLEQYEFATSFLKVGDYNMAERAFREFVDTNPNNDLSGNAQYWYAETFRIRQLYTDAASAYLEGYQKYPKSEKAPINLLKLGVSLVQIGEKDQGCLMIAGVKKQYPNATQSVLQKAKYEEKKFECNKENS
jgi:tol-pal system protein YbgF